MKILIVEDNPNKLREVMLAVNRGGCADEAVQVAHDIRDAKLKLRQHQFDLMILDLVIPAHPAEAPQADGGVKLLAEITEREQFRVPREVIGLTAFGEVKEGASEMFERDVWSIVVYDPTSTLWSEQVSRKVSHLLLAERAESPLGNGCFLCIITALPLELEAVLRLPWNWKEFERPNDVTNYYRGEVSAQSTVKTVYAATTSRMGMTAVAILATKMIEALRPEFIVITGITGGVKGRCELGDVILADPAWDWGSGKHFIVSGNSEFAPAPHQLGVNSWIRMKVERLSKRGDLLENIRKNWPGDGPNRPLRLLIGPVASGSSVLADAEIVNTIERQHRKLLGIEMESYGVYAAAAESRVPQPAALSLKSVSDFADTQKDDSVQRYAAYVSAETLRVLVERFL